MRRYKPDLGYILFSGGEEAGGATLPSIEGHPGMLAAGGTDSEGALDEAGEQVGGRATLTPLNLLRAVPWRTPPRQR